MARKTHQAHIPVSDIHSSRVKHAGNINSPPVKTQHDLGFSKQWRTTPPRYRSRGSHPARPHPKHQVYAAHQQFCAVASVSTAPISTEIKSNVQSCALSLNRPLSLNPKAEAILRALHTAIVKAWPSPNASYPFNAGCSWKQAWLLKIRCTHLHSRYKSPSLWYFVKNVCLYITKKG